MGEDGWGSMELIKFAKQIVSEAKETLKGDFPEDTGIKMFNP